MRSIICSQNRTGSNFLRFLLVGHPELRVGGELCNPPVVKKCGAKILEPFPEATMTADLKGWLKHIWAHCDIWNAHDSNELGVYDLIAKDKRVKVVFLSREDKMAQLVSQFIAFHRDVWVLFVGSERPKEPAPFVMDKRRALQSLWHHRRDRETVKGLLRHHESIDITYEQLAQKTETTINRVTNFLGVSRQVLQPTTQKILTKHPREYVINYDEICALAKRDGLIGGNV